MQEDFDIVTLTSENVLDYVDHTKLNLIVGRHHSGRTMMSQILALLTAEALFDQDISLSDREEIKCLPRPVFVDDEQTTASTDRAWRSFVHMGLKNWPTVFEQNAHHSYTPASSCLTLKTPFHYVVHAVSGVFEPSIDNARGFWNSQINPAPMFMADHRIRNLTDRLLLKAPVHFCSLVNVPGHFGPNEFAEEHEGYGCILVVSISRTGRPYVYGYGIRVVDDKHLLLPLPADAVRKGMVIQSGYTGKLFFGAQHALDAFKTVMEDKA